ncbi:helix-turn-helix transcriptional regulator [Marinobacter sp. C2H3]|uniref:helix-turn-helix transcriptional regulator n=1 Tax=Marinobacter sp. C2H3 TaxID=3119003 RepID=UPI00300F2ACD
MRVLRLKDVMEMSGLARSTIYKYINADTFPRPIPLGGRSVGWVDSEVHEWIAAKIKNRDIENHQ